MYCQFRRSRACRDARTRYLIRRQTRGGSLKEIHDIAAELDPDTQQAIDRIKHKTTPQDTPEPIPVGVGTGNGEAFCPGSPETEGFALGSNNASMVGAAGFEPATSRV